MSRGKVLLWNETIFTKSEYFVNVNFFKLYTRSIFDLYFFFFFFLMFYWMNYNFYSSVHEHCECPLNQQYKGCKSPKGQVQTGPWTHSSYSKNGEKAIQWGFRLSPFFFRLGSNAFPDIGSGGRTEKRNLKKITRSLGIGSPGTPGGRMTLKVNIHIFGLTKYTIYHKKWSRFCSCFSDYAVTMLISQMKRIISSEKWFN